MASKKQSQLTAATSVADADEMNIAQGGTSKRVPLGIVRVQLPVNYIGGLITSNGTDTDHDIDTAIGEARDSTNVDNMRLDAAITKQIDANWAVGDDAGGLDTGAVGNNTIYAVWLIKRSDTGVVDVLFSTSFTSPTMPTDYDRKRLIAAVRTDGSANIAAYTQSGDYFQFHEHWLDISDSAITSGAKVNAALVLPPKCIAHIFGHLKNPTTTDPTDGRLWIWSRDVNESLGDNNSWGEVKTASVFDQLCTAGVVYLDENSELQYAAAEADGSAEVEIRTRGFTMLTRREP
jgi:hypothetical protein